MIIFQRINTQTEHHPSTPFPKTNRTPARDDLPRCTLYGTKKYFEYNRAPLFPPCPPPSYVEHTRGTHAPGFSSREHITRGYYFESEYHTPRAGKTETIIATTILPIITPLHNTSGCEKIQAHMNWYVEKPGKAAAVTGTTLRTTRPVPADSRQ